ncbi:MAG TPA: L-glutamate gamma-semialdehyde dehydrogenase [Candidatus Sulfopaludibacter sp.]|jgi:1-pyrroline-5-carboxylate dehydrogenase|nr:L-glutamate gamma-semialdehyde dehydrogenase [Candidatus Sulfopaludibacter sp.]
MATATLSEFRNEAYTDFSQPANRQAMEAALQKVRSELGREYQLRIGGEYFSTGDKLISVNPSKTSEVVGIHHKASPELANKAVESAYSFFTQWSRTPGQERVRMLLEAARILRERKLEFDAWMVFEAGKTWIEAEAEIGEAIDFCEYYAREMNRLDGPQTVVQLPGEQDEMIYIPLGVGVVIPPWNFPLAILAGMTVASLVTGNTAIVKPSSETPTIAAKFAEVLLEAGFPEGAFTLLTGSGASVGDVLVQHPKTRFISFTGSRDVGLRINELAAKHQKGQIWIKRVIAEMGGKDAIVVDGDANVDKAVEGVLFSAFGYQGQKCSACSRAIIHEKIYDEFVEKLTARAKTLKVGPSDDPSNYMGPVISDSARKSILKYIETGKQEGRMVAGDAAPPEGGYYIQPTIIADVDSQARIFQEEIFGPVLAITKAKDFDHALDLANDSVYGLTGAVFSGSPDHLQQAKERFHVGNLYFNRKCTGAMVGAHPFGGFNMSGTDSKAGGPDYLLLFLQAKSVATKIG